MNNIIIGAGDQKYDGWLPTHKEDLDLTKEAHWKKFQPGIVNKFLCEHVFEHLTLEEGKEAANFIFTSLIPGGFIRVAVPDVNFPDEEYQRMVQIGGPGPKDHPAIDHKIVYDYRTLKNLFEEAGFSVDLLEYCDENKRFHYNMWNIEDGP